MQVTHLPAVMEIEREAFALPWPEHAYRHELTRNELAHYYVLCALPSPNIPGRLAAWRRLWQAIRRRPDSDHDLDTDSGPILGYGGFWLMYDEAHISTLAVGIEWRRKGLGEMLLITLLDEARRLGASRATLEVRVSNLAAQGLYAKYGFEQVGRRKAYYADNGEDALILTTPDFASRAHQKLINTRQRDLLQHLVKSSTGKKG